MQMSEHPAFGGLRARVANHVEGRIVSGEWQPGDRIPSENDLVATFQVSRMTVHHALRDLTARGFLIRRSGSGTFVAEPGAYVTEYRHLDVIEEIVERGSRHRAEVLRRDLRPATEAEAEAFGTAIGEMIFHAVVLYHEDDLPLELEDRLIAPRFLPDAMAVDLSIRTLFSRLMLVRPYREGSEVVRAVMGTEEERQFLDVAPGLPCLEIARRTWSPEGVVTVARMLRAGERARLEGRVRNIGEAVAVR